VRQLIWIVHSHIQEHIKQKRTVNKNTKIKLTAKRTAGQAPRLLADCKDSVGPKDLVPGLFSATKAAFPFSETLRDFSEQKHRFRHGGLAHQSRRPDLQPLTKSRG
jgi:hypothetical protein